MKCRSCKHEGLESLINLGSQYLSDFRTDDRNWPSLEIVATAWKTEVVT